MPTARLDYAHVLPQEDRAMADEQQQKTPLEKLKTVVSQLKDIEHHARNNLERLSEIWLLLEEDFKKKKALAERVNDLLKAEGAMEDLLKAVIQEFDKECADMQKP
jgi:signal transduction protein with GAF and PtsI domain